MGSACAITWDFQHPPGRVAGESKFGTVQAACVGEDAVGVGPAKRKGKAAEDRRSPRRWRVGRQPLNRTENLGVVRKSFGTLKNRLVAGACGVTVK